MIPGVTELLDKGVLGICLAISIFLNYFFIRLYIGAQNARIEDAKRYGAGQSKAILRLAKAMEKLEKKIVVSKRAEAGYGKKA